MQPTDTPVTGFARYRAVLAIPGATRLFLGGLVGRLPIGITPVATVLAVNATYGSYTLAGITVGLYTGAVALTSPLLGRLGDRRGPRLVLTAACVAHIPLVIGLVTLIVISAPIQLVWAAIIGVGVSAPPIHSAVRSTWNRLIPTERESLRSTALSLDTIGFESCFVLAPVVVGVFALAGDPVFALGAAGACAAIGVATIAGTSASGATSAQSSTGAGAWAVISTPGMPSLLLVTSGLGFALGALDVTVPAFAGFNSAENPEAVAAALFVLSAVGSVAGGLWFGARHFRAALATQWAVTLTAVAVGFVVLSAVPGIAVMAVAILLCSVPLAAALTVENTMVAKVVAPDGLGEAYGWTWTVTVASAAAGQVLSGIAIGAFDSAAAGFLLAAAGPALAAILASWPRTVLRQAATTTDRAQVLASGT